MSRAAPPRGLVFVGERRSPKAQALGVSLQDGRLAARTLHDALRAADVDPAAAVYVNLFHDDPADRRPCENAVQAIRSLAAAGALIVALGRHVQAGLRAAGVPFVPLTHPAARGAIRARPVYQQHVRDALAGALQARAPRNACRTAPSQQPLANTVALAARARSDSIIEAD
jgi:hypothetical protein